MSTAAAAKRPIPWRLLGLVVAVVAGAVGGAYWDWQFWGPMSGPLLTMLAVAVLILGGIVAIVRSRGRTLGILLLALGGGTLAGQALGPSRPALELRSGSGTVALISPTTTEGNALVDCYTSDGSELEMIVDQNLRLDLIDDDPSLPTDIDQREFFGATFSVGDRWMRRGEARPDGMSLLVVIGRIEADLATTEYVSTPSSTLDADWTNSGGTLRFSGLRRSAGMDAAGPPLDLTGTITWTC